MALGQLNKISLVLWLSTLVVAITCFVILRYENDQLKVRLNVIEASSVPDPEQGRFVGIEIESLSSVFGDAFNQEPYTFTYEKVYKLGVRNLIPDYYLGKKISEKSINTAHGKLYIWMLEGGKQVIWDAYIPNNLKL